MARLKEKWGEIKLYLMAKTLATSMMLIKIEVPGVVVVVKVVVDKADV